MVASTLRGQHNHCVVKRRTLGKGNVRPRRHCNWANASERRVREIEKGPLKEHGKAARREEWVKLLTAVYHWQSGEKGQ